jgi:hypothetical protein
MNKIILLLLITFSCQGQKLVYNQINNSGIFKEYQTKDGLIIKKGDAITIGYPLGNHFTFITQGNLNVAARLSNSVVTVSKIKSIGNDQRGYKVYLYFKGYGINCAIDYEAALETGEIKDPANQ